MGPLNSMKTNGQMLFFFKNFFNLLERQVVTKEHFIARMPHVDLEAFVRNLIDF